MSNLVELPKYSPNDSSADDHKYLVELACSTTLVPAYHRDLFERLGLSGTEEKERPVVVFVVCGGYKIDLETVGEYERILRNHPGGVEEEWTVKYDDGSLFKFKK